MVQHQIAQQGAGGPARSAPSPANSPRAIPPPDSDRRRSRTLEAHLRDGLTRMKKRGKLRNRRRPAALATATMASIQGGLLLTQVRRDPKPAPRRPQRSAPTTSASPPRDHGRTHNPAWIPYGAQRAQPWA